MKIKTNKTSIKFGILILLSIIVLIMPILVVHTFYFKNKALWLFKSKDNAYQYLQFIGTFLGVIVTVLGTFIAIERQMSKEKELQEKILKQQKEMDIQIKLREDFIKRILETKKSIYNLSCCGLSIDWISEKVIKSDEAGEKDPPLGIEKLCIDAKKYFSDAYERYSKNMSDLITQIENYKDKLKYIQYDYDVLQGKYSTILNLGTDIDLKITSFPQYTIPMMRCINHENRKLDHELTDLIEELTRVIEELNKYYKKFDTLE